MTVTDTVFNITQNMVIQSLKEVTMTQVQLYCDLIFIVLS